jgi:hypothetical protein
MATRSRAGVIGIQTFLDNAECEINSLTECSPEDLVVATMDVERKRLLNFLKEGMFAAEDIVRTGILPDLTSETSYLPPPHARPLVKLRPPDSYYWGLAPKALLEHPGFRPDLIIPASGCSGAVQIEAEFISAYSPDVTPTLDLRFEVNHPVTIKLFRWLLQEWRRPVGQILRGLPNLQLWGNGDTLDGPEGCRAKDPATRLEFHLAHPPACGDHLFSLQSSFSSDDIDQDVVLTLAVFLSLFDAVYRLTAGRADPDRLLRHYQLLVAYLPKAPFRITSILPQK